MKRVLSILIAAGMALFATAQAGTVYNYTITDSNQKADVGQLEYLSVSYDTDEKISFKAKLGKSPAGVAANGGWFVLSPGANPKGIGNELAIFYMDLRYEGGTHGSTGVSEPDLRLTDNESLIDSSNTGNNESVAYMGMLDVLLAWHAADPVEGRIAQVDIG